MKKKKLLITALVTLLIVIIGGYYSNNTIQEGKLIEKVNKLDKLLNSENPKYEELNKLASKTETTGKYKKVEQAYNNFVLDLVKELSSFQSSIKIDELSNLLSIENIKKDGKDFVESLKSLNESKESVEKYRKSFTKLFSDENIESYIEKENASSSMKTFYKEKIMGTATDEDLKKLNDSLDNLNKVITQIENVINFLKKNSNSWEIQGENIAFSSNELVNEYNKLVNEIGK